MHTQHKRRTAMSTKHNFQIRMNKDLFNRVKALAEIEHRSISAQIQAMLERGLKDNGGEK